MRRGRLFVTAVATSALILGLTGCSPTVAGGPAEPATMARVHENITTALESLGPNGSISELSARHFGFSRGGLDVTFSYTEVVGGGRVTIPIPTITFADSGDRLTSHAGMTGESYVRNALVSARPYSYRADYAALANSYENAARESLALTDADGLVIDEDWFGFPRSDPHKNYSVREQRDWFDSAARLNLTSDDPDKRAFLGYYDIDPHEALEHEPFLLKFDDGLDRSKASPDRSDALFEKYRAKRCENWDRLRSLVTAMDPQALTRSEYQMIIEIERSARFRFTSTGIEPATAVDRPPYCDS